MRHFWKRDDDDLEQQLRARRSEAPSPFVRALAHRAGGDGRWFRPRVRYALVGALGVAVLAGAASAGVFSVASTSVTSAVNAVVNLAPGVDPVPSSPGSDDPSGDQYGGECGRSPRVQCHIELKPDNAVKLKEGNSGTKIVAFTVKIAHKRKSDGSAKFSWTTVNGTALSTGLPSIGNPDYVPTSGTYTFPPGTDTMPGGINVLVNGDTKKEPDEKFFLDVTTANAATTKIHNGSQHIEIKIENDDR